MSRESMADDVWRAMTALVFDNRDGWKREVVETSGLPFSRIRVLRRIAKGPMTATQIAEAATMDAPATTVAVNDLEDRGLVMRSTDPTNRRCKLVSLTDAGHDVLALIDRVDDPPPHAIVALGESDLRTLREILAKLKG